MTVKKKQPRREKTEKKILDAFEEVLLRDGAHNISVMSISREANVAKTLIYRYFGGLVGLIRFWITERQRWPDLQELFSEPLGQAFDENPLLYQKESLLRLAELLRANPLWRELMLAELMETGPVTSALRELRMERLEEDSRILGRDLSSSDVQGKPTMRIFYAAISYLALRARTSPEYMGSVRLDTDEGWREIMADLEEVFDDLIAFHAQVSLTKKRLKSKGRTV